MKNFSNYKVGYRDVVKNKGRLGLILHMLQYDE